MLEFFVHVVANADTILDAADYIITGVAIIAALTPTDKDDTAIARAKNLLAAVKPLLLIFRKK